MIETKVQLWGEGHIVRLTTVVVDQYPDRCPICLHAIGPVDTEQHWVVEQRRVEIVFRCPRPECQHYFVARYNWKPPKNHEYSLFEAVPLTVVPTTRSEVITSVSPDFVAVCREAEEADRRHLKRICGPGYRKALEFLIKDYIIKSRLGKADEIKGLSLGKCIKTYIKNAEIRLVAERAVWLGNDEAHYLRKWAEKDLNDLRTLIELTVHWIEMEHLTEQAVKGMPKGR